MELTQGKEYNKSELDYFQKLEDDEKQIYQNARGFK